MSQWTSNSNNPTNNYFHAQYDASQGNGAFGNGHNDRNSNGYTDAWAMPSTSAAPFVAPGQYAYPNPPAAVPQYLNGGYTGIPNGGMDAMQGWAPLDDLNMGSASGSNGGSQDFPHGGEGSLSAQHTGELGPGGTSLKRGQACSFCRRRKLKCSGERPKCTSCVRYNQDCEYAPPPKVAKYQALETKISELSEYIRQNTAENAVPPLLSTAPAAALLHKSAPAHPATYPASARAQAANGPARQSPPVQQPTGSKENLGQPHAVNRSPAYDTTSGPSANELLATGYLLPEPAPTLMPYPPDPSSQAPRKADEADLNDCINSYLDFSPQATTGAVPATTVPPQAQAEKFTMTLSDQFYPFGKVDQNCAAAMAAGQQMADAQARTDTTPPAPPAATAAIEPRQPSEASGYQPFTTQSQASLQMGLFDHMPGTFNSTPNAPLRSFTSTPRSTFTSNNSPQTDQQNMQTPFHPSDPKLRLYKTPRQSSVSKSSPSDASTPESSITGPPLNSTVDPNTPNHFGRPLPSPAMMYGRHSMTSTTQLHVSQIDPIDGITESLGEFLFNPKGKVPEGQGDESRHDAAHSAMEDMAKKKRRGTGSTVRPRSKSLIKIESDGLTDAMRESLLDCFLAHSRLFFEMSIPRFRYRMTFTDRRRPAPALLYSMYLWATRMTNSPQGSPMEQHFFTAACRALDMSSANADRLIDCMRAAMLLGAYSYTSGRYHEGWIFAGMAVRMVLSTGLHQIRSCVFEAEAPRNPYLRNRTFLLAPAEDATELAERISTFWCILAIERCGALATGFPSGIADHDILTPFPRAFTDMASRSVTEHDNLTIRDLYRNAYFQQDADPPFTKWMKAVVILERASKLAFIDPDEDSDYARAWSKHHLCNIPVNPPQYSTSNPMTVPPAWLDQPKYRCPKDFAEVKLALDQLRENMGVDGIFPVDRRRNAEIDGAEEPIIIPHTIMLHHQFAATHMLLHDINAEGVENKEALVGARRATALIRYMPPLPYHDVDSFCITVWSIIAKVLIKEIRRLALIGDAQGMAAIGEDIDLLAGEMQRVGVVMGLARSQAKAIAELKKQAMDVVPVNQTETEDYPHRFPSRTASDYLNNVTAHRLDPSARSPFTGAQTARQGKMSSDVRPRYRPPAGASSNARPDSGSTSITRAQSEENPESPTNPTRPLSPPGPEANAPPPLVENMTWHRLTAHYAGLVLASMVGCLIRLGLDALATYDGRVIFPLAWAQGVGCGIMGLALGNKNAISAFYPPLYTFVTTGIAGSVTTFSSWMLEGFLAFSNAERYARGGLYDTVDGVGYSFATWLISLGALHTGSHFAAIFPLPMPRQSRAAVKTSLPTSTAADDDERRTTTGKARLTPIIDGLVVLSAVLSYLVALLLYFLAPTSWRHRATFAILLAPVGTMIRFALSKINTYPRFINRFPLGTFIANILATAIIAAVYVGQRIPSGRGMVRCNALYAIQQGFCGCLSTVSTFVVESRSVERKRSKWIYVGSSVVLGHLVVLAIVGGTRWGRGLIEAC